MCQDVIMVAQMGNYQYLAYCEHQTIYLGWGYGLFHLRPADFLRLVRLLDRWLAQPTLTAMRDQGYCCLVRQTNGCYQLWVGDTALFLTEPELPRLVELIQLAMPQVSHLLSDQFYNQKYTQGGCFYEIS